MSTIITRSVRLETLSCASCGMTYAAPETWVNEHRDEHDSFYCPNGHSQWFPAENEAERFKRLWKSEQNTRLRVQGDLNDTANSLRATKGVVTKMRKRAIAGTCAFCHRHFTDVERHVASKHPGTQP